MRQQRHCIAKNVRDSRACPYHSRRCFRGRVALSVHRRAKPPVYKVGLVGVKGYATHGGGSVRQRRPLKGQGGSMLSRRCSIRWA